MCRDDRVRIYFPSSEAGIRSRCHWNPSADHKLIWPALAVYRHFYELELKELMRIRHEILEEPEGKTIGHGLPRLLDRAILLGIGSPGD